MFWRPIPIEPLNSSTVHMSHYHLNFRIPLNTFLISILLIIYFTSVSNCSMNVDCFLCAQNVPSCPPCVEDEACYIIRRTCYQCSRAICAKESYERKRKSCKSKKRPKCDCSKNETCLITVRNRIACSKAICIDLIDDKVKYLEDYKF